MPAPPELVYPVVPKCDTGHRGPNRIAEQAACQLCTNRKQYMERIRKWEIRHGERPARRPRSVDRRASRCPQHRQFIKGCIACRDWARYEAAVRRDRARRGVYEPSVPVEIVQAHLRRLLDKQTGGWKSQQIIDRSGVGKNRISTILGGRVKMVQGFTWAALRALEPTGEPTVYAYHTGQVSSLEAARIVQGLLAQAWTPMHIAGLLGYTADDVVLEIARHKRKFMRPEKREAVRGLADKLGPYNGVLMAELMPGMDLAVAGRAADRGFMPLAAWDGQDLADPAAVPGQRPPTPAGIPADDGRSLRGADRVMPVDEVKMARIRAIREKLMATDGNEHRADGYILPVGRITRLEQHVLTAYATHLGMSAAEVAEALGYPSSTPAQIESGQRAICRILADVRSGLTSIQQHPAGRIPSWLLPNRDIRMASYLPALLAIQPAPVGLGMTVAQLAALCGVDDDVLHQYLARAARRVNAYWKPQPRQRRKQRTSRCAQSSRTRAA